MTKVLYFLEVSFICLSLLWKQRSKVTKTILTDKSDLAFIAASSHLLIVKDRITLLKKKKTIL